MTYDEFLGTARFQIVRQLGAGGMGVVYEAFDHERQSPVALKTLLRPSPRSLLRLKREFRSLQDLHHPNLVTLGELIEDSGVWFLTMELLRGCNFLEWVRHQDGAPQPCDSQSRPEEVPPPDQERLRDGLRQLAAALIALHDAGKMHRDVKPSNVMVTERGRVVLLDFGLVADCGPADFGPDSTGAVVGTATYMAPEQATGEALPASDWYSVGTILYEALTGRVPFGGKPIKVLMEKQRAQAPSPRQVCPGVPEDLARLCGALLERDPARRPSPAKILHWLGVADSQQFPSLRAANAPSLSTHASPFVGRNDELARLHDALAEAKNRRAVTVCIHGESGIGKTALVRQFTDELLESPGQIVILRGRCYEREAVPYKAVDGVVDELARFLQRMPEVEVAAVIPRYVSLLLQAFPIMRRVPLFAEAPREEVRDPQELRTRVFASLRDLLQRLSERRKVVVVIDDLQWADDDSFALLREILRPEEPPSLLLVASWRETGGDDVRTREQISTLPGDVRHVSLSRLSHPQARDLAAALLSVAGVSGRVDADRLAREADGHPFFIDELARHAGLNVRADGVAHVEDALWTRIAGLEPRPRRLLEVLAIAGAPLDQEAAARAPGLEPAEFAAEYGVLRVGHLACTTGARGQRAVETYHDRVRAAVMSHLDADARRDLHLTIARAIEGSSRRDPEALAVHFRAGGQPEKAAEYASIAASAASNALAFDRAARFYREAMELMAPNDARFHELQVLLGDALASAGRGTDAARTYLEAARSATAAETLDLKRRAAQQLLITGRLDEGVEAITEVLASEHVRYPKTPKRALLSVVLSRARLKMRGMKYQRRDETEVASRDLARIDALWHTGIGLATADTIRGNAFLTRSLLLALRTGEPYRIARGMAIEGGFRAIAGGRAETETSRILALAGRLAEEVGSAHAIALVMGARGQAEYLVGRFPSALQLCRDAEAIFRERCVGVHWEINTVRLWAARSLQFMGEFGTLARSLPGILRECQDRGDLYGEVSLRASVWPLAQLMATGDESAARAEVSTAEERWTPEGFHVQHYYSRWTYATISLYAGDAEESFRVARALRARLQRSLLARVQITRLSSEDLLARAALACGRWGDAEKAIRRIERARMAWSDGLAAMGRAGLALGSGRNRTAIPLLEQAASKFEGAHMRLHAAVARRRLAALIAEEDGRSLEGRLTNEIVEMGVFDVERVTALLAPVAGS